MEKNGNFFNRILKEEPKINLKIDIMVGSKSSTSKN